MISKTKAIVFLAVLIGVIGLVWATAQNEPNSAKATYSQFLRQVQSGEVNRATIVADHGAANPVTYRLKDGALMRAVLPPDYRDALEAMQQKMVDIEIRDASSQWPRVLANSAPFLILLGFWFFMLNRLPKHRDAK